MGDLHLGVRPALQKLCAAFLTTLVLFHIPVGPGHCGQALAAEGVSRDSNVSALARPSDAGRLPPIGLGVDAGIPDGVIASLVLRPSEHVRLHLGAGSNTSSPGFRGGISLLPFGHGPSLSIDAGHYLAGEASGLVETFFAGLGRFSNYVGKIDYTFVNGHAGFDFALGDFTLFLHGGVTYLRANLRDVAVPADAATSVGGGRTTLTFREDPVVRMWTPSAKLGLIYFLN
jgi:hypothetical protein